MYRTFTERPTASNRFLRSIPSRNPKFEYRRSGGSRGEIDFCESSVLVVGCPLLLLYIKRLNIICIVHVPSNSIRRRGVSTYQVVVMARRCMRSKSVAYRGVHNTRTWILYDVLRPKRNKIRYYCNNSTRFATDGEMPPGSLKTRKTTTISHCTSPRGVKK